jgi:Zn-dependent protease with chaperone function
MHGAPEDASRAPGLGGSAVYYDGTSSRRHPVRVVLSDQLELNDGETALATWPFAEIRRADGPAGILRLSCLAAPQLARLEIRDANLATALISRCRRLDDNAAGRHSILSIAGWSLAATISIVLIVLYAIPLAADRLAPLVPEVLERRLGDATEKQIRIIFGNRTCTSASGRAAFDKLLAAIDEAAGVKTPVEAVVLAAPVPNAFALPGGKVYLFSALLAKANDPDEIAGALAHELGHLKQHDATRNLIYNGGTSFLIGLLFGDVTGSGALIFASRSLLTASHSREAEQHADSFSIEVMHALGRPTKPMGELLLRVTGKQGDTAAGSILASHPLTEDRLERMSEENRPSTRPPLLTDDEWAALKSICDVKR